MNEKGQFLAFRVEGTLFSFPLSSVIEIIEVQEITQVPLSYDYILGVINLRGSIVSVVDLRKRLFGESSPFLESSRIVIVSYNGDSTGFLVDEVVEVEEVEIEDISSPEKVKGMDKEFVSGIFKTKKDLISILIPEKLIELDDKLLKDEGEVFKRGDSKKREDKTYDEFREKILIFSLGESLYAFDIEYVREIIRKPEMTDVPSSSEGIEGVFEIRDEVLPAINIAKRLGISTEEKKELIDDEIEDEEKVVIFKRGDIVAGIIVDRIEEVVSPMKRDIVSPPETFDDSSKRLIKEIYRREDGRLVFILNEESIIERNEISDIKEIKRNEAGKEKSSFSDIEERNIVIFSVGGSEFALSIEDVSEINRLNSITPLPEAPSFIEGIINLRGDIIPIINMRVRLSFKRKEHDDSSRIVIVNIDGVKTGLIVDSVEEIKSVPITLLKPVPDYLKDVSKRDVVELIATLDDGKRIVSIIELEKLLKEDEREELKTASLSEVSFKEKKKVKEKKASSPKTEKKNKPEVSEKKKPLKKRATKKVKKEKAIEEEKKKTKTKKAKRTKKSKKKKLKRAE